MTSTSSNGAGRWLYFFATLMLCLCMYTAKAQLSGTYTIDPSGSGSTNFTSFKMAVDTLNALGVSGAVTITVADGTYNEQVSIPAISGASASNTITFQSKNADSTKVTLSYASSTSSTSNYVLELKGADYITFRQITFERTGSNTYGTVVAINSAATHNQFLNDRFLGVLKKS